MQDQSKNSKKSMGRWGLSGGERGSRSGRARALALALALDRAELKGVAWSDAPAGGSWGVMGCGDWSLFLIPLK